MIDEDFDYSASAHERRYRARRMKAILKVFGLPLAGIISLMFLGQWCDNTKAVQKCESLRKQGVKGYVAETFFTKECVVLQRDVSMDEK